jgi:hypothetical protein
VSGTGTVTNTATLGAGVGPTGGPTGTITFSLFGPDNMICSGAPILTSVKTVTANGAYTSDPYAPTAPGKYSWKLAYSGDANNVAQHTGCSDPTNQVTVGGSSAMTVTAGPSALRPGEALTVTWSGVPSPTSRDLVGLYPVGGSTLVVGRYTSATASGTAVLTVPANAAPGSYEVRLRTVKSGVISVY